MLTLFGGCNNVEEHSSGLLESDDLKDKIDDLERKVSDLERKVRWLEYDIR